MQRASKGKSVEELMSDLDNNLVYGGARKITEYESELLDQIDENYDYQIKMQRELKSVNDSLNKAKENTKITEKAVNEYCSEMTANKILLAAGFQFGAKKREAILSALSDKELLEKLLTERENTPKVEPKITMQSVVSNAISNGIATEHVDNADRLEQTEKLKQEKELEGETKDD